MVSTPPDAVVATKTTRQSDTSESSDDDQPTPAKKMKQEDTKSEYHSGFNIYPLCWEFEIIPSALDAAPKEEEEKENKKTIDIGKEAAIEAEVRAARERAIVPLETRIKSFRDMLAEKDVKITNCFDVIQYMQLT